MKHNPPPFLEDLSFLMIYVKLAHLLYLSSVREFWIAAINTLFLVMKSAISSSLVGRSLQLNYIVF